MSYKVLARKWRPQHFDDMIGQEPVLRALINALDSDRLHHAYLFTGMRGVGKTTIARIFAKCLNCEERGVSANPCGQCSACKDIEAGRFFDLIEVDAASRTKVESTRELLENVPYAPASGRYKVYLIDEVHMFSTHSFNALLKTLEEPPEHVKFILATTDPQKVPATVLSRCLQFNLKRMSPSLLTDYLAKVLTQESVEHEMPALELIARASEGSVRDSLSLVEQAAAIGQGAIRADEVESMLGRASVDRLLLLIETLASGDMVALFEQVDQLAEYAPEFSELLGELLSLLHRIAVLQSVPGALADSEPGFDHLVRLAGSIEADVVQLFYQIGLHARRDMPFAPDPRDAFDMALLRMNAFKPQESTGGGLLPSQSAPSTVTRSSGPASTASQTDKSTKASPATRVEDDDSLAATPNERAQPDAAANNGLPLRGEVSAGGSLRAAALAAARGEYPAEAPVPAKAPVTEPVHAETVESTPAESDPQTVPPTSADRANDDRAKVPAPMGTDSAAKLEKTPALEPAEIDDKTAAIDKDNIKPEDWPTIVNLLDIAGMPLQLASNTLWQGRAGDRVTLRLESDSEHLDKERFVERLREALGNWLGRTVSITLETVDQTLQTPAKIAEQQRQDALAAAHDSITLDPMVKQLVDSVDGAIDEASIQPLGGS